MKLVVLVFAALFACANAQGDENGTTPEMPNLQMPDFSSQFQGMLGSHGAAIGMLQAQQLGQNYMGKFVIELQSVMAWMQAAKAYAEKTINDDEAFIDDGAFEEEIEEVTEARKATKELRKAVERNLEMAPGPNMLLPGGQNPAQNPIPPAFDTSDGLSAERNFELAMLYITKLMYIDSIYRLDDVQKSHYQSKVMVMMVQPAAHGNPYLSQLLYMLWYKDVIATMKSAIFIQMQDSWTFFFYNDIIETNEFKKSVPESFAAILLQSRATAMQHWYLHSLLELQTLYLNFYVNAIVMQAMQGVGGVPPAQPAAAAASLLETESQTGSQSIGASPYSLPMYYLWMQQMLRLWAKVLEFQVAGAFATGASMGVKLANLDKEPESTIGNEAILTPGANPWSGNYLGSSFVRGFGSANQQETEEQIVARLPQIKMYSAQVLQMWVWVRAVEMFMQLTMMALGIMTATGSFGGSFGSFGPSTYQYAPQQLVQTDEPELSPVQASESVVAAPEQPAIEQPAIEQPATEAATPSIVG